MSDLMNQADLKPVVVQINMARGPIKGPALERAQLVAWIINDLQSDRVQERAHIIVIDKIAIIQSQFDRSHHFSGGGSSSGITDQITHKRPPL